MARCLVCGLIDNTSAAVYCGQRCAEIGAVWMSIVTTADSERRARDEKADAAEKAATAVRKLEGL